MSEVVAGDSFSVGLMPRFLRRYRTRAIPEPGSDRARNRCARRPASMFFHGKSLLVSPPFRRPPGSEVAAQTGCTM